MPDKTNGETPAPWRKSRPPSEEARVQQAWSTVWRVVGLLVPIISLLVGAVWMQNSAQVDRVAARAEQIKVHSDARDDRMEQRSIRALESIDRRLSRMEKP